MSNQKIIINEVDTTTPRGSGVSSDVVYVPGLAVDTFVLDGKTYSTPKNTPVLCTTVAEFEATFGPAPYILQRPDVDYIEKNMLGELSDASVSDDTVVASGSNQVYLDKSYMYAKELINAGLAVLYENISPTSEVTERGTIQSVSDSLTKIASTVVEYTACKTETTLSHEIEVKLTAEDFKGTLLTFGEVTFIVDKSLFPDDKLQASITNVESDSAIFEVSTDKDNNYVVEWTGISAESTFDSTITVTLQTRYSGEADGVKYPVSIHILDTFDYVNNPTGTYTPPSRVAYMRENLVNSLTALEDKNSYSIKYVTSGGYPSFVKGEETVALESKLINLAYTRGDCVAIIDHEDDINEQFVTGSNPLLQRVNKTNFGHPEFAAMFTPWGVYNLVCNYKTARHSQLGNKPLEVKHGQFVMPASFGYFMCLAAAVKTGPNFIAMAGVSRGVVNGLQKLHTNKNLTNVIAEDFQPKYGATGANTSINAITNIRPYGLTIWGNRTLLPVAPKGSVALNFLNVRNMVSDIKKVAYDTAKVCMFEQENDTLWLKFKSGVSPLLEQLKSGSGIKDYKIIKLPTKYDGSQLTRGEMSAVIKIFPVYPVEYFEITVVITDDDVSVS